MGRISRVGGHLRGRVSEVSRELVKCLGGLEGIQAFPPAEGMARH